MVDVLSLAHCEFLRLSTCDNTLKVPLAWNDTEDPPRMKYKHKSTYNWHVLEYTNATFKYGCQKLSKVRLVSFLQTVILKMENDHTQTMSFCTKSIYSTNHHIY